jgi:hypothetical protein
MCRTGRFTHFRQNDAWTKEKRPQSASEADFGAVGERITISCNYFIINCLHAEKMKLGVK